MKAKILILSLFISGSVFGALPHIDLDLSGQELESLIDYEMIEGTDPLKEMLNVGKRNIQWLEIINQSRPEGKKFELSNKSTQVGTPIETPRKYNRQIVTKSINDYKASLDRGIYGVLFEGKAFTNTPPVNDEAYITAARAVDKLYQTASRWLLLEPYLSELSRRSFDDIRGFYFLKKIPNITETLKNWNSLDLSRRQEVAAWLVGICHNAGGSYSDCQGDLKDYEKRKNVLGFYNTYIELGQRAWNNYFSLRNPRRDLVWSPKESQKATLPFVNPRSPEVMKWLSDNIEDEWHFGDWQLKLNFGDLGRSTAHVVFEPGATPHVNIIGGSEITMDANRPIQEYSSRWTIRHEFGHVLGFPDCYLEFYDENEDVIVSYQLDIQNLMCSRVGHLQQTHYDEMKRNYYF